jgi:hypothetical protein
MTPNLEYVLIPTIQKDAEKDTPIFPGHVDFLLDIPIPTKLAAAEGGMTVKTGTGISVGGAILICRLPKEKVLEILGAKQKNVKNTQN